MINTNSLTIGILAHVDAGKTTLSEALLYLTGRIRKLGRVDHQNAFLDTFALERARGITIFSKQALFDLEEKRVTLLDTPGHADFSAEMERTLQVLDYAVLVISGTDGVQGHVEVLWQLLKQYKIPVLLFINKMDLTGADKERVLGELKQKLDKGCVDFSGAGQDAGYGENLPPELTEQIAVCNDDLLERYLEGGSIETSHIQNLILDRELFPCCFGAALKLDGVEDFLRILGRYTVCFSYPEEFGARVYKISRDEQGTRLTHMKITGGQLKVKQRIEECEEKADQIRIYNGSSFESAGVAEAGTVCAVAGLSQTASGQGLGAENGSSLPILMPVLTYQIVLPEGTDVHGAFLKLKQLEEEEPQLQVTWDQRNGQIKALLMGDVQIEILKYLIRERFGLDVELDRGSIVYRETIAAPVEGVGHYEPLKHYAEVHLRLEPLERGAGLVIGSEVSEDVLDRNWQRLILTHLYEKKHLGVLTGSEITDMKITLTGGRAHLKHTEGGDFRQATYRAVRQGLRKAKSVLLEPVYEFRAQVPQEAVGRLMSDIRRMNGSFQQPSALGDVAVLEGFAPVAGLNGYQRELLSYTKGKGQLSCVLAGYEACGDPEPVIARFGYDPEGDSENPTGSIFCVHGAGFAVAWDHVEDYMHLESGELRDTADRQESAGSSVGTSGVSGGSISDGMDAELKAIFARTYRRSEDRPRRGVRRIEPLPEVSHKSKSPARQSQEPSGEPYLIVDGYNVIFSWEELRSLTNLDSATEQLADLLCNYNGFKQINLILVFDAYKRKGNPGSFEDRNGITIVYTRENQTADQYIETLVHKLGKTADLTVATSDSLERQVTFGFGARRMSTAELKKEVEITADSIRDTLKSAATGPKNYALAEFLRRLDSEEPEQEQQ